MKLNIDDNIQQITEAMDKFNKELLKMEGSLQVFKQLKSMGINEIDINNSAIIEKTEVIDDENTSTGSVPPSCGIH
jgi:hypothetical protein